jgi:sepiapterin reductase
MQQTKGKAGRDMFHRVLAKEHTSVSSDDGDGDGGNNQDTRSPSFKVLNYAPGPCDTEMTNILADDTNTNLNEGIQKYFVTSKKEQTLIRPEDTAKKLIQILTLDEFESGSHVDYFDSEGV